MQRFRVVYYGLLFVLYEAVLDNNMEYSTSLGIHTGLWVSVYSKKYKGDILW